MITFIRNKLELRKLRKELKECEHMLWLAHDQVASGKAMIYRQEQRQHQIHARIAMLEPPDQIVRMAGAGT